jgi:NADH dehydrogenase (ubiquinone) 1 alpha/beta subcomplex 1
MLGRVFARGVTQTVRRSAIPFIQVRAFSSPQFLDTKVTTDRVFEVLGRFEKIDKSKLTPTASFSNDLGLDSLDSVEVVLALEDEFGIEINDEQSDAIRSVEDAVKFISGNPNSQ